MIDIDKYNVSHKHYGADWKSDKYRKYLHVYAICMACGTNLSNEKEGFETHHFEHNRKTDASYLPLCLFCHNKLHYSAKSKEDWMRRFGLTEKCFHKHIILALTSYILELDGFDAMVNALSEIAKGLE